MFIIGCVAGPQDDELLNWAEHWKDRGRLLVIVQGTPEWFNTDLAKKLCKIMPIDDIYPMLPVGNPDVHRNTLISLAANFPENDGMIQLGTDEYMTDDHWQKLTDLVTARPGVQVFWVFRKNFYDGNFFDSMPGDYQPVITRGIPIQYSVNMHTYPRPACPIDAIRYLPDVIHIEHRRTIARVLSANKQRDSFATTQGSQIQIKFVNDLKTAWLAKGLEWPEVAE